ncbi:MAG: ABC transporter permease [Ancalomicrobiaceae bacterium]|nr:ABC transporter permease [Ancalomicrobiaceae bacterium]
MHTSQQTLKLTLLRATPAIMFVVILILFSILSPRFLNVQNLTNILTQSAYMGTMAIGMTFVLLIAGMDLSVGAVMYVSAVLLILYLPALPMIAAMLLMAAIGALFGLINAVFIVRLKVIAFVVTIATLYVGRGLALYVSSTRTALAPSNVLAFGEGAWFGVSYAIWTLAALFGVALWIERCTPFGRYLYAMGADYDGARKAGIPVGAMTFAVYVLCGMFAGIGGFISLSQTAAASSNFGYGVEFPVVAAAVLGGTSLFGGRGSVVGSVFGAVLIQTVQNGLVLLDVNPYLYPLVISGIIFIAVLLDSQRTQLLSRLTRRQIRTDTA